MKYEEAVPDGKQAVQPPALMHAPRRIALLYRIAGMQRQQAMFQLADEIEKQDPARGAFYVAADVWSMAKGG